MTKTALEKAQETINKLRADCEKTPGLVTLLRAGLAGINAVGTIPTQIKATASTFGLDPDSFGNICLALYASVGPSAFAGKNGTEFWKGFAYDSVAENLRWLRTQIGKDKVSGERAKKALRERGEKRAKKIMPSKSFAVYLFSSCVVALGAMTSLSIQKENGASPPQLILTAISALGTNGNNFYNLVTGVIPGRMKALFARDQTVHSIETLIAAHLAKLGEDDAAQLEANLLDHLNKKDSDIEKEPEFIQIRETIKSLFCSDEAPGVTDGEIIDKAKKDEIARNIAKVLYNLKVTLGFCHITPEELEKLAEPLGIGKIAVTGIVGLIYGTLGVFGAAPYWFAKEKTIEYLPAFLSMLGITLAEGSSVPEVLGTAATACSTGLNAIVNIASAVIVGQSHIEALRHPIDTWKNSSKSDKGAFVLAASIAALSVITNFYTTKENVATQVTDKFLQIFFSIASGVANGINTLSAAQALTKIATNIVTKIFSGWWNEDVPTAPDPKPLINAIVEMFKALREGLGSSETYELLQKTGIFAHRRDAEAGTAGVELNTFGSRDDERTSLLRS